MRWLVSVVLVVAVAGCGGGQGDVSVAPPATEGNADPATADPGTATPDAAGTPSATEQPAAGAPSGPDTPTAAEVPPPPPGAAPEPTCVPALPEQPTGEAPTCEPGTAPGPEVVVPQPGAVGAKPIPWESAMPIGDGSALLVSFYSGVAPCTVLARADVVETPEDVTVTLQVGSAPGSERQVCIEIAQYQAVEVDLAAPLGDREVVDGAT